MRSPSFTQRDDADDGQSTAAMKPRTHTATPTPRTAGPLWSVNGARCVREAQPPDAVSRTRGDALLPCGKEGGNILPVTQKGGGTPRQFEGRGDRDMATATMRPADDVKVSRAPWRAAPPSQVAGMARARMHGWGACAGVLNGRAWRGGRPAPLLCAGPRSARWGGAV